MTWKTVLWVVATAAGVGLGLTAVYMVVMTLMSMFLQPFHGLLLVLSEAPV